MRSKNFGELNKDPVKPLLNRAIMGQYPPGSTLKMANDLVGLQMGVITKDTRFSCQGPGSSPIKCTHNHVSPLDVYMAIQQSCNPFHWQVFRAILNDPNYATVKERYDVWRNHLMSMGFGRTLNTDLAFELKGNLPSSDVFDKIYGKGHWNAMTVRSLSIGQGEVLTTPLQLVNYAAMVANRGYFYPPHVVRSVGTEKTKFSSQKNVATINPEYLDVIVQGMTEVFSGAHGTARAYKIDSLTMAGKTGTAPVSYTHLLPAASRFIEIYRLVDPQNAEHRYMAAKVAAMQNNKEGVYSALQQDFGLGFKAYKRLKSATDFEAFRQDKKFQEMVAGK